MPHTCRPLLTVTMLVTVSKAGKNALGVRVRRVRHPADTGTHLTAVRPLGTIRKG